MKVNNKKANVELPIDPANKILTFISGIKDSASKQSKLGQSMAIVNQRIRTPIKVPITCIADTERPTGAGINRKKMINSRAIIVINDLFLFSFIVDSLLVT